jgi:hypothetical protein
LETEEGFTYPAVSNYDAYCGPRRIWDVPPGATFTMVDGSRDGGTRQPWGWVYFEIPQGATPRRITFAYGTGVVFGRLSESYESSITTAEIREELPPSSIPFDPSYSEYLPIYAVGESIPIGDLAEVVVQSVGTGADARLPISIEIRSLDQGYPHTFDLFESYTSLIFEDGFFCCQTSVGSLGWEFGGLFSDEEADILGPLQSRRLEAVFENPGNMKAWMVGGLVVEEKGGGDREASLLFIVELP